MEAHATSPRSIRVRATIALFLVSVVWGFTFLWMKQSVDAMERVTGPGHALAGAAFFLALRFGLATALLAAFVPSARRGVLAHSPARAGERARSPREAWLGGAWLGGLLVVGFVLQMA